MGSPPPLGKPQCAERGFGKFPGVKQGNPPFDGSNKVQPPPPGCGKRGKKGFWGGDPELSPGFGDILFPQNGDEPRLKRSTTSPPFFPEAGNPGVRYPKSLSGDSPKKEQRTPPPPDHGRPPPKRKSQKDWGPPHATGPLGPQRDAQSRVGETRSPALG